MKRSEINQYLKEAEAFFRKFQYKLPPFADWTPQEFVRYAPEWKEMTDCELGWDITDFGHGDFLKEGLLLFTVRNGILNDPRYPKTYAEKIMISRKDQKTLMHCHLLKREDIINRGGGKLVFELYNQLEGEELADTPVSVAGDGRIHHLKAGEHIALNPGESLTLTPGLFHSFWAEGEDVLIGEVSSVNDDHCDNLFHGEQQRFPERIEDEEPYHLLVCDYKKYL